MTTEQPDNIKKTNNEDEDPPVKPDPETLNTTDPQEHMEGPISSLAHKTVEGLENDEPIEEEEKESDE